MDFCFLGLDIEHQVTGWTLDFFSPQMEETKFVGSWMTASAARSGQMTDRSFLVEVNQSEKGDDMWRLLSSTDAPNFCTDGQMAH